MRSAWLYIFLLILTMVGTVFYILHPNRKNGFGEIGLDKELAWRHQMGLPVQPGDIPGDVA